MSTPIYIFTALLPFVTALLIFGMRYVAQIQQAKARLAGDEAYHRLAQKVATDQAAALAAIETRLAAIEKILRDVG
ncbi:MAG TPA: hypothetical protein PLO65_10735 [Caulobacter sp.]|nr:hypothetical protein [Caulobacter sp.]